GDFGVGCKILDDLFIDGQIYGVADDAVEEGTAALGILLDAFENDTNFGGVHLVEMDPEEMAAARSRVKIKWYVADQYIGARSVLASQAKWLRRSQDIWKNETCCVLTLNWDFIARYPKAVQELTDGYVGSGFFIDKNHNMTVQTVGDRIAIDKKTMDECFKWGVSYASLRPKREDLAYLYDSLVRLKILKARWTSTAP
ncbi:MAG: ABC transporter substrate-binding protein, partial [Methanothrix sp.]|nr:ABC transporter substrate-binding protein [Methanothrix sp.]